MPSSLINVNVTSDLDYRTMATAIWHPSDIVIHSTIVALFVAVVKFVKVR